MEKAARPLFLAFSALALTGATPATAPAQEPHSVGKNGFEGDTPVPESSRSALTRCLVGVAQNDMARAGEAAASVTVTELRMTESRHITIRARHTDAASKMEEHIHISYETDAEGKPSDAFGTLRAGFTAVLLPGHALYAAAGANATAFSVTQTHNAARLADLPGAFYTNGLSGQFAQAGAKPVPWKLIDRTLGGSAQLSYAIQKKCAAPGA